MVIGVKGGTALALARADAWSLFRGVLVLAGLLTGGVIIWIFTHLTKALWWNVDWVIGYGQLCLAMAVLIAAQLASGRPRRDAMADLYASFPAAAATRTIALLIGLVGAAPASLLLIVGTAAAVEFARPIGVADAAALASGSLLVFAAGAIGIAIGAWFPHPLAGVLGALAFFVPFSQSNRLSGPGIWLYPWMEPPQLAQLPGPLAGYPPVGSHAAELAGFAFLAVTAALAAAVTGPRARVALAIAGILGLAATCLAAVAQARPIPASAVNHLVLEVADPASAQHCTAAGQARYCLYPGFGQELAAIQSPVGAVFARLPVHPAQRLTIMQAAPFSPDITITHGYPPWRVARWDAQLRRSAGGGGGVASVIYLPVTVQPSAARFVLALAAGEWAVHLPPTITNSGGPRCVPLDQAREAIAIWLALLATRTPAGALRAGLIGPDGLRNWGPVSAQGVPIAVWDYPGENLGDQPIAGPLDTAAGYLLAAAMTSLPERRVNEVLRAGWARWVGWRATDDQLAAALGIRMPAVPAFAGAAPPAGQPPVPVCTT